MSRTFAVIGGGIAGASIAYHLGKRTSDRVVLFDRGQPSAETTARSVGQFGYYGDGLQVAMKRYGMELYNRLFATARRDIGYHAAGLLSVARTDAAADRLRTLGRTDGDPDAGKVAGSGWDRDFVRYLEPGALRREVFVPPLDIDVVTGAVYRPRMGYMSRPGELGREFVDRAREHGVDCRFETAVTDVRTDGARVQAVVADEELPVDAVACAAGPWNPRVADLVDLEIPVSHTLAPVLQVEPTESMASAFPAITEFDGPHAIHHRGHGDCLIGYNPATGYRPGKRLDPAEFDDTVPRDIREGMMEAARTLTPAIGDGRVTDSWVGVRSQTPDGNPIAGPTAVDGFFLAAFHTSGIQLSPAVGDVLSRQILDAEPTGWEDGLAIDRFEDDHRGCSVED